MTKQSMASETDVNQIMARWIHQGLPPIGNGGTPKYGDFSNAIDFQTALDQVREAQAQFDLLPAHVRRHCQNDPAQFLEMAFDPERRDELVKLGLAEERLPEKPDVVPPVAPPIVPVVP